MAETASSWVPRDAWAGVAAPGRFGADGDGVLVTLRSGLGLASLIAGQDGHDGLAAAARARLGLDLPSGPGTAFSAGRGLIWSGPSQWLLLAEDRVGFDDDLAALAEHAAVADQSHSRAVLRLAGPRVRDALAKGCMLDLHPAAFPPGHAAATSIAHIGVQLWRRGDAPEGAGAVFEMAVPRSMAGSFWSWLTASAAEFGATVVAGGPDRPPQRG